jgi:hypothetical protein
VWGSYPQAGLPERVQGYLENLHRLELTPLERSEPELAYIFKHITTQEVAYESMAFATREGLNENIGHFIEDRYADELSQYVNELAHYYGRSRNKAKQGTYFRLAGDAAKAAYANQPAIDYYQRLLPLLPESEQAEVRYEIGEIRQLTGQWEGQKQPTAMRWPGLSKREALPYALVRRQPLAPCWHARSPTKTRCPGLRQPSKGLSR